VRHREPHFKVFPESGLRLVQSGTGLFDSSDEGCAEGLYDSECFLMTYIPTVMQSMIVKP